MRELLGQGRHRSPAHVGATLLLSSPMRIWTRSGIRPYRPHRTKYLADAFKGAAPGQRPDDRAEIQALLEARGVPLVRHNLQR